MAEDNALLTQINEIGIIITSFFWYSFTKKDNGKGNGTGNIVEEGN